MKTPILVTRHNRETYENSETEALRKDNCMCLHCTKIKDCTLAKRFLDVCISGECAFIMTRCSQWSDK